jgi:hypothetical protein
LDQTNPANPSESDYSTGRLTVGSAPQNEQRMLVSAQPLANDSSDRPTYSGAFSEATPTSYSTPMRLTALIAALLLAAAIASGFFRVVSLGQSALAKVRRRRRVDWEKAKRGARHTRAYPVPAARADKQPRELHRIEDPNDRMTEFITQLRRPA